MDELERRTMGKVTARLVPFLIVCYFVAYLDRVNVGFAGLGLRNDLGLSASAFGLASGIFFLAYFVFEVPSNLALDRFGARRWIARIMFTWGLISGATAFITGEYGFYALRVLLGIAEAGFFPGIIFFLTLWFPQAYRARIVGFFMAAIPASTVIGAPVSSMLLDLEGMAGLHGWQWMFILEAVPALIMSVAVLFYLTDRPADATWLTAEERTWLAARMDTEARQRDQARHFSWQQALFNPRVLALSAVYFGAVASNYGTGFWLPQIVSGFGKMSNLEIGLITAIPYVVGLVGMVWWGQRSDRLQERKWHTAIPLIVAAAGIAAAGWLHDPMPRMLALSVAGFGVFACLPVFWTLPTAFLTGVAAASGIAAINSLGNLSGFAGPYAMGVIKDMTGSFDAGLYLIAALCLIAALIVLGLGYDPALERASPRVPAE